MEHSPDTYQTELGVSKFIEFLNSGKLEIKAQFMPKYISAAFLKMTAILGA